MVRRTVDIKIRCWLEGDSGASETIVSKWFWNNVLGKPTLQRTTEITSPNEPEKTKYADLIRILDETFGFKATLFSKRYEVNAACDRIDYSSMEIGQFKALVFVSGLKTPECEEIHRRILHVLEAKPNAKQVDLRSECEAYQKLKTNVQVVTEERGFAAQKAKMENDQWKKHQAHGGIQRNNGECYRCGRRGHHFRECNLPGDIQCDYCGRSVETKSC
uniref:CCHC-type domain-containing protein n=1 Tax=Acrobeloides nanus TaxID=290746 RepID=A0A914DSH8_9BILA